MMMTTGMDEETTEQQTYCDFVPFSMSSELEINLDELVQVTSSTSSKQSGRGLTPETKCGAPLSYKV